MSGAHPAAADAPTSVRTPAEPTAFTGWELWRSALIAWIAFELLYLGLGAANDLLHRDGTAADGGFLLLLPAWLLVSLTCSGLATVLLGLPLGGLLGLALRRRRRSWHHVLAFALLGAAVGAIATLVMVVLPAHGAVTAGIWLAVPPAAAASAIGWCCTMAVALDGDRRDAQRRGAGQEARP